MSKVYQIIMQDEYNNLTHLGFYKSLEDSIKDINEFLELYDVKITKEDLKERKSTFGSCFDTRISDIFEDNDIVWGVEIRGFVFEETELSTYCPRTKYLRSKK